ncbi:MULTISPECIES: hypothetical protein [Serratia]|uniref:hypothetical protein n=1 Tax=Serratia TaxID=613 RepID=UPI00331DF635
MRWIEFFPCKYLFVSYELIVFCLKTVCYVLCGDVGGGLDECEEKVICEDLILFCAVERKNQAGARKEKGR